MIINNLELENNLVSLSQKGTWNGHEREANVSLKELSSDFVS